VDSGLGSVRWAISASFGRRPRFGLPTQVQRDVAETLSVVWTKLLSFYRDDPFEHGVGNIVQAVEAKLACNVINIMTGLGMPVSYRVA